MPRSRCLSAFVAAAGLPVAAFGQPTSWLDAVDGTWSDAARWVGGVPGAGSDVTIDATGAVYTSTIDQDFLINSLTLDSANATLLLQSNRALEVVGTANLLSGVLRLNSGVLRGGIWNVAPGTLSFSTSGNNILDGVTLNGDVTLGEASSTVRIRNGTTISGIVDLAANGARVGFEGDQTIATDIVQTAGTSANITIEGATTLTLGAGASITGTRIDIGSAFAIGGTRTFINDGEINANAANATGVRLNAISNATNNGTMRASNGGRLQVTTGVDTFTNNGAIVAEGGSDVSIQAANWTNSGTITAMDSTLSFSGAYSTGAIGLVSGGVTGNAASTLTLGGIADNTGQTLASNVFGGTIRFNGGMLLGGTLDIIDPADLLFTSSGNNIFDGVAVNGTLVLGGPTSFVRLRNGTTVSGGIELAATNSRVGLDVGITLSDDITQTGGTSANVSIEGTGTATIASGTTITGTRIDIGGAFAVGGTRTLVNEGTIIASGANSTGVRLNTINDVTNNGTIRATGGGRIQVTNAVGAFANTGAMIAEAGSRLTIGANNWTNVGTITAVGDGVIDIAGNASTAAIGLNSGLITGDAASRLNLSGVLDNVGQTISTDDFGGVFAFEGGRINGGTLEIAPGSGVQISTSGNNVLDGVSVIGDLALAQGASTIVFRNGTGVSGEVLFDNNGVRLALDDTQTFDGQIRQVSGNSASITVERAGAVVTLGSLSSVTGSRIDIGSAIISGGSRSLVNEGVITAAGPDPTGVRVFGINEFTNDGIVAATGDGRFNILSSTGLFTNNGSITGDANTSITVGASAWTNSAGADITSTGGSVALGGNWQNDGQISVTNGMLTLGGSFATDDIGVTDGRLDRTGSSLSISGVVDNASDTIDAATLGGAATLAGGTIVGGTVDNTGGQVFDFTSSGNNVFDGVAVLGDLDLDTSTATLRFLNASSVSGTVNLTGNGSRLLFDGSQTFDGVIAQSAGTVGSVSVERDGTVLTLGNASSVSAERMDIGSAFVAGGTRTLVNNGAISADAASQTGLRVLGLSSVENAGSMSADADGSRLAFLSSVLDFSNTGVVHASMGARVDIDAAAWTNEAAGVLSTDGGTLGLGGAWINLGQINAVDGTIDLGGAFTSAGSGVNDGRITGSADTRLAISGDLDNTGAMFDTSAFAGRVELAGGTVRGGTLLVADALGFSSSLSNQLDGVTVDGDLRLDGANSTVQLLGGTTVSGSIDLLGNGSRLILRDTQTVGTDVTSTGTTGSVTIEGDSVVTVASGATISGRRVDIGIAFIAGGGGALINDGAIRGDVADATGVRVLSVDTLTNNGEFSALNGGRFSVLSTVVDFTNLDMGVLTGGVYRVGEGSRMNLNGDVTTNAAAIELLGANAQFDGLEMLARNEGELTIANDVEFAVDGDLEFADGGTFRVLVGGAGDMIDVPVLDVAGAATLGGRLVLDFSSYAGATEGTFRFLDAVSFAGDWGMVDVLGINPTLVTFNAGPGTFNLVPAPGALGVLAAAGVIVGRRRR